MCRAPWQRVILDGIPIAGRYSLAAGRDALYVVSYSGQGGRWRLPWPLLDGARWATVGEARLNGEPLTGR